MPNFAGTIPAVRERPKVAKKPTILPPPAESAKRSQKTKEMPAARLTLVPAVPRTAAAETPRPAPAATVEEPKTVDAAAVPASNGTQTARSAPAEAAMKDRLSVVRRATSIAPTIPPVKARPKVAKRPTITGPTIPAKKPLVKKKAEPKESTGGAASWIPWLPLAVGIVLGFIAPQLFALASVWNPWGLRVVFPFVQFVGLREIGMSDELTRTLPQLMLYLQFPLEGLLVANNLRRGMRASIAVSPIFFLHFVSALVLWIVALGSSRLI